jgi:hypothetical protein
LQFHPPVTGKKPILRERGTSFIRGAQLEQIRHPHHRPHRIDADIVLGERSI